MSEYHFVFCRLLLDIENDLILRKFLGIVYIH